MRRVGNFTRASEMLEPLNIVLGSPPGGVNEAMASGIRRDMAIGVPVAQTGQWPLVQRNLITCKTYIPYVSGGRVDNGSIAGA